MGKIMLNGVDYSTPTQSGVSGVKGNAENAYRTGQVNLTPANIGALATNGDSKDVTTSFSSSDVTTANATTWTDTAVLASGEKHSSVFAKLSQMFKNIRYLYNNKIDLSKILTTVEQCTASTNNQNIASAAVIKELNSSLLVKSLWNNAGVSDAIKNVSVNLRKQGDIVSFELVMYNGNNVSTGTILCVINDGWRPRFYQYIANAFDGQNGIVMISNEGVVTYNSNVGVANNIRVSCAYII